MGRKVETTAEEANKKKKTFPWDETVTDISDPYHADFPFAFFGELFLSVEEL